MIDSGRLGQVAGPPAAVGGARLRQLGLAVSLLAILLLALARRLPRLAENTFAGSEGIRLAQLDLLSAGYQACADVFCNQGPLALQVMYPTFALFGETLAAARSSVVIGSLVALLGVYWIAAQLWGARAGLLAAAVLLASPAFTLFSRRAQPEVIALALAVVAVGAAVRYDCTAGHRWLALASACYALSLLVKPVGLTAIIPLGLLLLGRVGLARRDLLLATGIGLAVVLLVVLGVGPGKVWEQVVFRYQSRLAVGLDFEANWSKIVAVLRGDRLGLFLLAGGGVFGLFGRPRRPLAAIVAWNLATLGLLLVHTPLREKHLVIILPPIALLAGHALEAAASWLARLRAGPLRRPAPVALVGLLGGLLYLTELPGLVGEPKIPYEAPDLLEGDAVVGWYDDAAAALRAVTPPNSFVVTEQPFLTFMADRLLPPQLVEISATRVKAGALRDEQVVAEAERFGPRAILYWSNVLVKLPAFRRWVNERYQAVRVYDADRETAKTLYLPRELDPTPFRSALSAGAPRAADASFGGLRLERWGLDQGSAEPGELRSLTAVWEAERPLGGGLSAVVALRSADRAVWTSQRLPLLGNGDGNPSWGRGRWIVWSGLISVPQRLAPGTYTVTLQVTDAAGQPLALQAPNVQSRGGAEDAPALSLTTLTVRPAAQP